MTIIFGFLKTINKNLTSDEILNVLKSYDSAFFEGWLKYNKLMNPSKSIDEYIIDFPASQIDEINALLNTSKISLNCQRPVKNKETNQWEVWDFAYEENGERYYELHKFFTYEDAIDFWKVRNPKLNVK